MNANDIIEKCAEICDRYAVKNHEAAVKASRRASRLLEIDSVQRETAEIGSVECESAALEAAAIANEIRALKSSLPAETVSEAMVEQARLIIANEIKCHGFVKSSGLCVRGNLEKHCDCREAVRQILALAHADDGWRAENMPPPDRVIQYNDGMSAPAMFHYSTENCDARTIARESGFEISFVTMESELGDDHPLMKAYADDGELSSVLDRWKPTVPDGWKLGGKSDSEDGPVALLLRPLPASPKDGRE